MLCFSAEVFPRLRSDICKPAVLFTAFQTCIRVGHISTETADGLEGNECNSKDAVCARARRKVQPRCPAQKKASDSSLLPISIGQKLLSQPSEIHRWASDNLSEDQSPYSCFSEYCVSWRMPDFAERSADCWSVFRSFDGQSRDVVCRSWCLPLEILLKPKDEFGRSSITSRTKPPESLSPSFVPQSQATSNMREKKATNDSQPDVANGMSVCFSREASAAAISPENECEADTLPPGLQELFDPKTFMPAAQNVSLFGVAVKIRTSQI